MPAQCQRGRSNQAAGSNFATVSPATQAAIAKSTVGDAAVTNDSSTRRCGCGVSTSSMLISQTSEIARNTLRQTGKERYHQSGNRFVNNAAVTGYDQNAT